MILLDGMVTDGGEGHIGYFPNRQRILHDTIKHIENVVNVVEIGFHLGKNNIRCIKRKRTKNKLLYF